MRIVLDTNVALSALLWRGTPYRLLDAIRNSGDARLFTSPALLDELSDVLTRPSVTKRLAVIGRSVREVLDDYIEAVEVVEPEHIPRVVPNDADDDHVLACAVVAQAELIVSGDQHLVGLGSNYQGIAIVTPAQAVQRIAG